MSCVFNSKVVMKESNKPGLRVVVMAGVHGNELCGVKALDELIPKLKVISGRVAFVYANLEAIKQNKRFIEYNLNRCFLGDLPAHISHTLEGKTAKELVHLLEESDVLLDIHASTSKNTVPFIICEKQSYEYAKALPFSFICGSFDDSHPGATDGFMNKFRKPALCVVCGYLGDKSSTETAKKVIKLFLAKTKSIKAPAPKPSAKKFFRLVALYKNQSPIFKLSRPFSDFEEMKERTMIGFDGEERVFAEKGDSILFAVNADKPNQECFCIARPEKVWG